MANKMFRIFVACFSFACFAKFERAVPKVVHDSSYHYLHKEKAEFHKHVQDDVSKILLECVCPHWAF